MNTSLTGLNKAIQDYEHQIAEESHRMEGHTQARREEISERLEEAKEAVLRAEQAHKAICEEKDIKKNDEEECKQKGMTAETTRNHAQERIAECNTMIRRCKEQEKNSLAPYGRDMKAILEQIGRMRWHGEVPVGPLGLHVKLKDQTWAPLLRSQLGTMMSAFACTDARDRAQLKQLFQQSKK